LNGEEGGSHLPGRIEWVDVAKGVGIILVVFGHSLGGMVDSGMLNNSRWGPLIVRYIYVFHMPLFFFLAGMFVAQSAHRTIHDYLANKASVIVYPYFLWSLLAASIQIPASRFTNNHFSIDDLPKIIYQPIDQYWFLYVIFLMYMVYWWTYHRGISNDSFLVVALILYAIEALGLNILKWEVFHSFCSFLIYFALGAKAADTSLFTDLRTLSWIRLSGLAAIGYVLIAAAVATNLSNLPFLHAVLAIAGMIATIALAILISSSRASSFVRILGVYSLEIYVAHTIFAGGARIAMQKGLGYSEPLLHVIVGTTIGICIPLLLAIWAPRLGLPYLFTWSRLRRRTEIAAVKALAE
jgi:fucose 4-O-acetylase-like acetyltransferase